MSRLIFSNNIEIVNKFNSYCNKAGFVNYQTYSKKGVCGSVFKKIKYDNDNYLSKENCTIAIVGTFFYDGLSGRPALEKISGDLSEGVELATIREHMIGAFACVIEKNDCLYAFSDATGIYYYYYSFNDKTKEWIIGTSLYGLAKSSGQTKVNEFNLLEACFQGCVIGSGTIFNDFYKIEGDYCVVINMSDNTLEKRKITTKRIEIDDRDIDVLIKDASSSCHRIGKTLKRNFENKGVALLLTGGLDSRIVVSTLLSEGVKPTTYYGVGNSPLAPTTKNDFEVVKQYCSKFKFPLYELDWSIPEKIDMAWDKYIEQYGEIGTMYASSPIVYEGLEGVKEQCVLLGSFGEVYRNHTLVEKRNNTSFTIGQILDFYYLAGRDMKSILGDDYREYRRRLEEKWIQILEPYLKNGRLPKDYFSVVEYWKRRYSDAIVVNFLNQTSFSFSMLSEPDLLRYSFIPTEKKDNAGFIIKLTKELYPDVLSIPIYSRYRFQKIDWDKMELVSTKQPYWKAFIRKPLIYGLLKRIKSLIFKNKANTYMPEDMLVKQTKNDIVNQVNAILCNLHSNYSVNVNNSDYLPKDVKYAYLLTMAAKLEN